MNTLCNKICLACSIWLVDAFVPYIVNVICQKYILVLGDYKWCFAVNIHFNFEISGIYYFLGICEFDPSTNRWDLESSGFKVLRDPLGLANSRPVIGQELVIQLDLKSEFFFGLHKVFAQQSLLLQKLVLDFNNLASEFFLMVFDGVQRIAFQCFAITLGFLL